MKIYLKAWHPTSSRFKVKNHFNATHGMTGEPEFNSWSHMIQRCTNPSNKSYANYGGRGITVCQRWRESFENFYADMGPKPSPSHSLERIDVNGNYEPVNCRWATAAEQASNTRRNRFVQIDSGRCTLSEAGRRVGVIRETVKSRIARGMCVEDALLKPVRCIDQTTRGALYEHNGMSMTAAEWAEKTGVPYKTLLYRLHSGWELSLCLTTPVNKSKSRRSVK